MLETLLAGALPGTTYTYGLGWGDRGPLGPLGPPRRTRARRRPGRRHGVRHRFGPVIVERLAGSGQAAAHAVDVDGGTILDELGIIDGFTASVPAPSLERLRSSPAVRSVTPDGRVRLEGGREDED